jgi:predicted metal-binding membrane protein
VSSTADPAARFLRHQRAILAGGIALLVGLSWWFVATGAGMDSAMPASAMRPAFAALLVMWWVMMAAMMLPSALPAVLLYARVRDQRQGTATIASTWVFVLGYLAVWLAFSIAAASLQWLAAGPSMTLPDRSLASAVLIAAGLYQLSPLKQACLRECRSPAQILSRHWRPGATGALRLGMFHGAYCVACCWLLMALLFVVGVMNLLWVVALTIIIAVEKIMPRGALLGRAVGVAFIIWGAVRIVA